MTDEYQEMDVALEELRAQLGRDEQILHSLKPDKTVYIATNIGGAIIIGIFMLIVSIAFMFASPLGGAICLLIIIIIGAIMVALTIFSWKHIAFAATNKRVVAQVGLFSRSFKEAKYDKITDTIVLRPFFERLFGAGTIGFNTAGGGTPYGGYEVVWMNIKDPMSVKSWVSELIEQQKKSAKIEEFQIMAQQLKGSGVSVGGGGGGGGAFCGSCGSQVAPGTKFCNNCGKPI